VHVVGTAGHVDHGKSTLVLALTGIDPDRFEEEKRRGLTIDLGFAWCALPSGREIGIVDVPGHERFIRNMLAGVGGIDAVVFVVAADEGWMPQSAEHLQILDFLDVRGGVVALTKSDTVDHDELELARDDVWQHLRGSVLHAAPIVPVSAPTGDGLDELLRKLDALLAGVPEAPDDGRPRLFVDRSFTIAGAGTVVTGTLTGGRLRTNDEVGIVPTGARARIRTLQTHHRAVQEARPGSRVAANLVGLERTDIVRGDALVLPGRWRATRTFAARLVASADLHHPLTARGAYELYLGTTDYRCRIKLLEDADVNEAIVAANTPSGLAPAIRPDGSALVQIFFGRALPAAVGDRFVIRDAGRRETVAGGVVLDQDPGVVRRGDAEELSRLRAREGLTGAELAARIVAERGAIRSDDLAQLAGVEKPPSRYVLDPEYRRTIAESAVEAVSAHHEAHPLATGIPVHDLADALAADADLVNELLSSWKALARDGATVRLATREGAIPPDQRAVADAAIRKLREAGASPPSLRQVGLAADLAKALERAGELVVVNADIGYPPDVWIDIRRRLVDLISTQGPVTVAQVREMLGTSRKYAVPLLERFDATGVTRRVGDVRDLGPRGRELTSKERT
jgi:selenocysteine-specific elongation factor